MSTFLNGVNSAAVLGSMAGLTPAQRMTALEQAKAAQSGQVEETGKAGETMFGSIFNSLIQNVKDTDAEFTQAQYLLATGQLDNPAQVGIAAYKAEISVSLLLQMRDRALTAYNELRNMNV